jgi:hypothetical protein
VIWCDIPGEEILVFLALWQMDGFQARAAFKVVFKLAKADHVKVASGVMLTESHKDQKTKRTYDLQRMTL